MTSLSQNVTMWSGDSKKLRFTVIDDAGAAKNLTGAAIVWKAAKTAGSSTALITKSVGSGITITDPTGGLFEVRLDPADTASLSGDFYHEAQVTDALGDVATVAIGRIRINADLVT